MLELLKKQSLPVDATTAVNERPRVLEAKRALNDARVKHDEAKLNLEKIETILAPVTDSSSSTNNRFDEIAFIDAQTTLQQVRPMYWKAQSRLKSAEREFQKVVEAETKALTLARAEARRELVQRLFAKLEESKAVAEEIELYDRETTALGGKAQAHPFGELLDEPYRTGYVTFRRHLLEKEGAL